MFNGEAETVKRGPLIYIIIIVMSINYRCPKVTFRKWNYKGKYFKKETIKKNSEIMNFQIKEI